MSVLDIVVTPLGWAFKGKRAGEKHSVRRAPQLAAPQTMDVASTAFAHGGTIPDRYSGPGRGENISPDLTWTAPAGTAQLLLVIEDIDVPLSRPGIHTIALLPPTVESLAEGVLVPESPGIRYVPAFRGHLGYGGPRPLPGHGVHRYGFHLYALDRELPADPPITGLAALLPLVEGHVLAGGFLEGVQKG